MRSSFLLAAILGATALCGSAAACVNDRDVIRHENEFKSRYNETPAEPAPQPEEPTRSSRGLILAGVGTGVGGAMLLGAAVMVLGTPRRKDDAKP